MKYSFYLLSLVFFFTSFQLSAQDADIPLNHSLYHYADRLLIKGLNDTAFFTANKAYSRHSIEQLFEEADTADFGLVEKQWHHRMRILADDNYANAQAAKGVWSTFYKNGRDFFHVNEKNFQLYVNPIVHASLGQERISTDSGNESIRLTNNSRGAVLRGSIYNKIGFYTEVYDNIILTPQFILNDYERRRAIQGESFIKRFGERKNAFDFFSSRAYITFKPIKPVRIKFGKDRAFWGEGYQSLFLSDQATDYLFLNIHTKIWKLSYTNHFAQMIDFIPTHNDQEGSLPRKYAVFHQLLYQPNKNLSFGFFESIVYSPTLANGQRGFELQYLNPIIFYRTAEQSIGSPDNGMLGFSLKYNFLKRIQFYGQLLIDDYNFGARDEGDNYWGNKLGYQVGLKYIDAFNISTLDLQLEYNRLRPYTYQHFNIVANYNNFRQSLGHSAGANLYDFHFIARYRPLPPLNIYFSYSLMKKGLDIGRINYGGDINRSYEVERAGDFDQTVAQGNLLDMQQVYARISWQLWKTDAHLEIEGRYRTENEESFVGLLGGVRMNLPIRQHRY